MATSSAQEIIEIIREDPVLNEDRVLKETDTIRCDRRIFKLACEHFRERGEGKG
jgi:hypothetical protein